KTDKIMALQPDCVFGFSDLQADIAADLVKRGVQVTIFNQRSVADIFSMLYQVAAMVGEAEQGARRIAQMQAELRSMQATVADRLAAGARRPKVFFEEWDEPHISCIRWVSELMTIAGGDDCFPELAHEPMGKQRIIADGATIVQRAPDIVMGSWCGKKFRPEKVAAREGWAHVPAVRDGQLFEIKSADILQPGPAALTDGLDGLCAIVQKWRRAQQGDG
ncbi:MAG: cobalamin-binding protein, partial [Oxalobacteraceae bacterium]|nr:cobalamin-binding protein [Oxalobacteraceae bacterium]